MSEPSFDRARQLAYHLDRFRRIYDAEELLPLVDDLTGDTSHEGWIGLDQMGHFGPHGCDLVVEAIAQRRVAVGTLIEVGCGFGGALRDLLAGRASARTHSWIGASQLGR